MPLQLPAPHEIVSPTAIVPDAQLIAFVELGPRTPNSIAMLQLDAPPNTVSASRGSWDLRPGRFDRQVILDRPDMKGRTAILNVMLNE